MMMLGYCHSKCVTNVDLLLFVQKKNNIKLLVPKNGEMGASTEKNFIPYFLIDFKHGTLFPLQL